jgi:hypothetical protein
MTDVVVREDDFTLGDFPAVCAKTGVDCDNPVAVRLRIGVRPIRGVLPIVRSRVRIVRAMMAVSYVALLFVLFVFTVPGLGIAAAGLYVVLYLIGNRLWLAAARADTREELVLRRVHPRFAAAVDEQYGRLSR